MLATSVTCVCRYAAGLRSGFLCAPTRTGALILDSPQTDTLLVEPDDTAFSASSTILFVDEWRCRHRLRLTSDFASCITGTTSRTAVNTIGNTKTVRYQIFAFLKFSEDGVLTLAVLLTDQFGCLDP